MSEPSPGARGASGNAAVERAGTPIQASPSTTRSNPGTSAAPMSGRPGATGERSGQHRSARYLQHTENGEEIVGELDDVAPPVIGGLNLDTTPDAHPAPRA